MEHLLATRSVSITELKRSPSAVLEQAGAEPVALLNHNRPAAYLLSPEVYGSMLERLSADLRAAIQVGMNSGPAIAADERAVERRLGARSRRLHPLERRPRFEQLEALPYRTVEDIVRDEGHVGPEPGGLDNIVAEAERAVILEP